MSSPAVTTQHLTPPPPSHTIARWHVLTPFTCIATVCYHANSARWGRSDRAWAMIGDVQIPALTARCHGGQKDRLVCWLVIRASMHSLKRTPGSPSNAHAHTLHTHTQKHTPNTERERERESTHFFFLHIHREEHTAAECLKGKRLHHLVVWQETFGHVFIRGDFRTVSSHSHRIYKHLNDRISMRLKFWSKIQIKGSKLKAKKHVIHSIILWATVLFMTFLLKCVSHCKLKHAAWHNYWYGPKKLLEIIYFIFF